MNIYPAILTDELTTAQKQLLLCQESGLVQTAQIDIIDGYFADNVTITPSDVFGMELGELELDFHLMTQEPIDYVYELVEYKDDLPIRSIIAQVEQMSNQSLYVEEVRRHGWQIGFSLNLHTPLSAIESDLWDRIQVIQLMAIDAGSQGQEFQQSVFEKINRLQQFMVEHDLRLELIVDGGVNAKNIAQLQEHGVHSVGVGSALWTADDFSEMFQELEAEVL